MSQFAGCCQIEVFDRQNEIVFPMLVMYPTHGAAAPVAFGPFAFEAAMAAPVADGVFPLVMISHGSGGSFLTQRTLAMHLAKNNFVVCMPEHPFNNRHNNELQYTIQNMIYRPAHIRLAIDEICSHDKFKDQLYHEKVSIVGHSVGGYTALALAGGVPHTRALVELCQGPANLDEPYWHNFIRKNGVTSQPIEVRADGRIKAVVLLAPDVSLFMAEGALQNVHVPILLLVAEADYKPVETVEVVMNGMPQPSQIHHRIVKNAGHYSFLSPFPEAIRDKVGDAARDPQGFDRDKFHQELNFEILGFLQNAIGIR